MSSGSGPTAVAQGDAVCCAVTRQTKAGIIAPTPSNLDMFTNAPNSGPPDTMLEWGVLSPRRHIVRILAKLSKLEFWLGFFFFAFRARPRFGHLGSFLLSANIFSIVLYLPFLFIFSSFFQFFSDRDIFRLEFFLSSIGPKKFCTFLPNFFMGQILSFLCCRLL